MFEDMTKFQSLVVLHWQGGEFHIDCDILYDKDSVRDTTNDGFAAMIKVKKASMRYNEPDFVDISEKELATCLEYGLQDELAEVVGRIIQKRENL